MDYILKAGNVILPAPVAITTADELIWSSDTGRTLSGLMIGDVIAEKKTLSVQWGILTSDQVALIRNSLCSGFFPITFFDDNARNTIEVYRGTLTKEHLGELGDGIYYYRSVTCDIVQR